MVITKLEQNPRIRVLAYFLEVSYIKAEQLYNEGHWTVYTKGEREIKLYQQLRFNLYGIPFGDLSKHSKILNQMGKCVFVYLTRNVENYILTDLIYKLIDDYDQLVEYLIDEYGYGSFLSAYNDDEIKITSGTIFNIDQSYYLYRQV